MYLLIKIFIDMCLLRAGPQDLPASRFLFGVALVAYTLVSMTLSLIELEPGTAMFFTILDVLLVVGLATIMLWIRDLLNRHTQTATALLGTGVVFGVVAAPLLMWQVAIGEGAVGVPLPSMLLLALMLWNLVVIGHIIRHALNTTLLWGVSIAVLYMFVSMSILRVMLSVPAQPPT